MTPRPTVAEMAERKVYDPKPGTICVRCFAKEAEGGTHAKDKLSDWLTGALMLAEAKGNITKHRATLFQVPFLRNMEIRKTAEHHGHGLRDPKGRVVRVEDRLLVGEGNGPLPVEDEIIDMSELLKDNGIDSWIVEQVFGTKDTFTAAQEQLCTTETNKPPYKAGPGCREPHANFRLLIPRVRPQPSDEDSISNDSFARMDLREE